MFTIDRIFKFLFSILLIANSAILIILSLGFKDPIIYLENLLIKTSDRFLLASIGLLGIILAIFCLLTIVKRRLPMQANVLETSFGKVRMTIYSLENLSEKVVNQFDGVRNSKSYIKPTKTGIAIFIELDVSPEVKVPLLTESIQSTLNKYFLENIGLEVEEIRILIVDAAQNEKSRIN